MVCEGIGPKFLKLNCAVRYRLSDIEVYEESCLLPSTMPSVAANVAA